MIRKDLINLISSYTSSFTEESEYKNRLLELLQESDCFLRSRLSGHITASCWITNLLGTKVLLMHHAKLDKWLQPGGHADGDEDLIRVAKKELYEETGLLDFTFANSNIFDLDIHTIPIKKDVPKHFHFDVRFYFIANNPGEIQKNHESLDLKWIDLSQVQDVCNNEKSIMRMVEKTIQMKQKQKTT